MRSWGKLHGHWVKGFVSQASPKHSPVPESSICGHLFLYFRQQSFPIWREPLGQIEAKPCSFQHSKVSKFSSLHFWKFKLPRPTSPIPGTTARKAVREVSATSLFEIQQLPEVRSRPEIRPISEIRSLPATTGPVPAISEVNHAYAGRLKKFYKEWRKITRDRELLNIIRGYKIPFKSIPVQNHEPSEHSFSEIEFKAVDEAVEKLLVIGAVEEVVPCSDQFVSNVFVVPKPDGTFRLIINLKPLNEFIENEHFKMEDYRTAMNLVQKGTYFGSIDLKDAYYLIPIHESSQKYLRFKWKGRLFEFKCMCFGLSVAPRIFTKVMKPVISYLRRQGFTSCIYLDDILLLGDDFLDCEQNIHVTVELL